MVAHVIVPDSHAGLDLTPLIAKLPVAVTIGVVSRGSGVTKGLRLGVGVGVGVGFGLGVGVGVGVGFGLGVVQFGGVPT